MSLTGQGLASGFQGGFKMMDDYYNRQENQLRNKEASDINKQNAKNNQKQFDQEQTIFDQNQKKIKVEETIKRIAATTKSGSMPSRIDTDYLQEAIGWDLYAELNPEFLKARESILNQEFSVGSPEFLENANLAFDSVLNKNNSKTDFTTQGRVLVGHRATDRAFSKTPSIVKGNKILHKKLIGGIYAMGGGIVGGDVEVTYEDKEGKTRTYIAPMTQKGGTSGDGDNVVGRDSSGFVDNLKGGLMLSQGMEPVLKRIGNLMVSQGIDIPISSIDKQRLTDYSATAQYHMNIANSSLRNLFPKASGDESSALIAAFIASGGDTKSMQVDAGTKPPEMNKVAHDTYVSNMDKAKSLYADVDTIYKKYSLGDYKSMSAREGFAPRYAEPTVPLEEAIANLRARWGLAPADTGTVNEGGENNDATANTAAGLIPDRPNPDAVNTPVNNDSGFLSKLLDTDSQKVAMALSPDYAQSVLNPTGQQSSEVEQVAPVAEGLQSNLSDGAPISGVQPHPVTKEVDTQYDGSFIPQVGVKDSSLLEKGAGLISGEYPKSSGTEKDQALTVSMNNIIDMKNNGTLTDWLAANLENQNVAARLVDDIENSDYVQPKDANLVTSLIMENTTEGSKVSLVFRRNAMIDAEIVDMNEALVNDLVFGQVMAGIANMPQHVQDVQKLLDQITALPQSNKRQKQWESVSKYLNAISTGKKVDDPKVDKWYNNPTWAEEMKSKDVMSWIENIIGMSNMGTLNSWAEKNSDTSGIVLKGIYEAMKTRNASPHLIKQFEAALSNVKSYK
tara:strand:- start:8162 stop:10528 length:2367 start_codon:yes stop_codon:yes gene_type:complete